MSPILTARADSVPLPALVTPEGATTIGKTLFVQMMDFMPWKTFHRIVARYRGDHRAQTLSCAEQYRCMAFAQLTYRESLRDIEACLSAQVAKPYHMGFRQPVSRSALPVMDRAYHDFDRLHALHCAGNFVVTRAKSNMDARRLYWQACDPSTGVICCQGIALNGFS